MGDGLVVGLTVTSVPGYVKTLLGCVPLWQRPGTFQVNVSPWCILLKAIKFSFFGKNYSRQFKTLIYIQHELPLPSTPHQQQKHLIEGTSIQQGYQWRRSHIHGKGQQPCLRGVRPLHRVEPRRQDRQRQDRTPRQARWRWCGFTVVSLIS